LRSNTAATPWRWPRAISTAIPTSASADRHHRNQRQDHHLVSDRFAILRAAGKTTALVGTIEYHLAGRVLPAVNTTPESLDLHRCSPNWKQPGGSHATMEVSSHALALGRVYGLHSTPRSSPT
jgi:hypothetical protein